MKKNFVIFSLIIGAFLLGHNWSRLLWQANVLYHHGFNSPLNKIEKLNSSIERNHYLIDGVGLIVNKKEGATSSATLLYGNYVADVARSEIYVVSTDSELDLLISREDKIHSLRYYTVEDGKLSGKLQDFGMDGIPDRRALLKNGFEESWDGSKWIRYVSDNKAHANN
jgi:hypothetical protein